MARRAAGPTLPELARPILNRAWNTPDAPLPDIGAIAQLIDQSVNSRTLSYRYVLPTQILAKCADATLDCHCAQVEDGGRGTFDARSLCSQVIVLFDRANHNVLGGSGDPYVSKPLRYSVFGAPDAVAKQRNGGDYAAIVNVLDFVEANPELAEACLQHVMAAVRQRLTRTSIVYGVPNRVSLEWCLGIVGDFLAVSSGGKRLQALAVGLFRAIGSNFGLFDAVESTHVNSADQQSGSAADVVCKERDRVALAVEVKDRQLSLVDMQAKLPGIREQGIAEMVYLARGGAVEDDLTEVSDLTRSEFAAGQNLYVLDLDAFLRSVLALMGESGRKQFLQLVGAALDEFTDIEDREAWRDLLQTPQN